MRGFGRLLVQLWDGERPEVGSRGRDRYAERRNLWVNRADSLVGLRFVSASLSRRPRNETRGTDGTNNSTLNAQPNIVTFHGELGPNPNRARSRDNLSRRSPEDEGGNRDPTNEIRRGINGRRYTVDEKQRR
jgi:hypothetical protein